MRQGTGLRFVAGLFAVVATPVLVYWLVGDQSSSGFSRQELDFYSQPPSWTGRAVMTAGFIATCILVIAAAYLYQLVRTQRMDAGWQQVVGILMAVGVVLAGGYRVMTAGVIGANTGAGLFLLFGLPFCVCLLVLSCIISFKTVRHPSARVQTETPRPEWNRVQKRPTRR